jgi:hypothetical protein
MDMPGGNGHPTPSSTSRRNLDTAVDERHERLPGDFA